MADPQNPQTNNNNLPNFKLSVRLKYVKLGYHYLISNGIYLALIVPLLALGPTHLSSLDRGDLMSLWELLRFNIVAVVVGSALIVSLATVYYMSRPNKVYLVNFACYKPHPDRKTTREVFMDRTISSGN